LFDRKTTSMHQKRMHPSKNINVVVLCCLDTRIEQHVFTQ
jgi:hypothetical protein